MKVYLLPESMVNEQYDFGIKGTTSSSQSSLKAALLGLQEYELEEAKRVANLGDCILVPYEDSLVPFQVVHKFYEGDELRCVLHSYYLLEKRPFDKKTNVYKNSDIRHYLNSDEFAKKFSKEFIDSLHPYDVHTDDYVTKDKFWIPSHEELGYQDATKMFRENTGTFCFDYYKDSCELNKESNENQIQS